MATATTKIKGHSLTFGGLSIGQEVSCSLTMTNNMEEAEYKDATNPMNPEQTVTSKSWQAQQEVTELDTLSDLRALITAALSNSTTEVGVSTNEGQGLTIYGNAWVNDLSLQATNRQTTRATIQYQGSGVIY